MCEHGPPAAPMCPAASCTWHLRCRLQLWLYYLLLPSLSSPIHNCSNLYQDKQMKLPELRRRSREQLSGDGNLLLLTMLIIHYTSRTVADTRLLLQQNINHSHLFRIKIRYIFIRNCFPSVQSRSDPSFS